MLKYYRHTLEQQKKHLIDKNEFIAPTDAYPYAKKHIHTPIFEISF